MFSFTPELFWWVKIAYHGASTHLLVIAFLYLMLQLWIFWGHWYLCGFSQLKMLKSTAWIHTHTHTTVHTFSLCLPLSLNTDTFSWVKYFTLKRTFFSSHLTQRLWQPERNDQLLSNILFKCTFCPCIPWDKITFKKLNFLWFILSLSIDGFFSLLSPRALGIATNVFQCKWFSIAFWLLHFCVNYVIFFTFPPFNINCPLSPQTVGKSGLHFDSQQFQGPP